jgi:F-type H+-transporting ATPase subunit a
MVSRAIGGVAVLLALGGLLWAAGPGTGGEAHPAQGKAAGHGQPGAKDDHAEHKLTAAEEVGDQDEKWYLFHELGIHLPLVGWFEIGGYRVPTKFMWLMLIAAALTFFIYRGLARRVEHGEYPRGPFWNFFETLLTFIRDDVAKPNFPEHAHHEYDHGPAEHHGGQAPAAEHAGAHHPEKAPHAEHPADRFVPLLWTLFIFILFCNLLGLFPFMGSPTANIFMTGGLALCVFIIMHGVAVLRLGGWGYIKAMWPKIDLPYAEGNVLLTFPLNVLIFLFKNFICGMIFVIELFSSVIKSGVLAIRLFANMFAGHMVLASLLLFIVAARDSPLWGVVTVTSVLGVIALSLLELFVAFLQAYIFTFLTALFIGMAVNPEH